MNRISKVRWPAQPTVTGKEITSGQKEKPRGKTKTSVQKEKPHGKKNNLTAKAKRIKNVLSASKKFCHESFSFCCEVFFSAVP